jgi:methionyl aminopeptidase
MDQDIFEKYRLAGRIAGDTLRYGASLITPGAKLVDVANEVEATVRSKGAKPAFPVNIAINEVAAHFSPKHNEKRVFETGEVVKLDVGVHVDGYIGDCAVTIEVGTTKWQGLIAAADAALKRAIELIKPKMKIRTIGSAIERTLDSFRVKPVINLTGHSMERFNLHAGKSVPNILDASEELVEAGDVLAIEPFSTTGTGRVEGRGKGNIFRITRLHRHPKKDIDNFISRIYEEHRTLPFSERWCFSIEKNAESYLKKLVKHGVVTSYPVLCEAKGSVVAQAEHTVIVTESGCEVIT